MNICIGLIGTINNIMEQKQYTAKQWSEIQGGHTMSETPKKQYSFISDLNESKMFKTRQRVEGTNARDMADFAFMNMLALYIMSNEYDMAPAAADYAGRVMMTGNFNTYRQSGNDLHVALSSLKNNMPNAGDKNEMQLGRINLNDMKIKAYLRTIQSGRPVTGASSFFLRLEKDLDIKNSNYRSIRRLVQDWPKLNKMQKQLVITRMSQFYRTKALRSELYSYIRDLGRTQGLMAKNAHNAERPRMRGSDTLAKIAIAGASIAGGYALGKAIGRNSMGDAGSQFDKLNQGGITGVSDRLKR